MIASTVFRGGGGPAIVGYDEPEDIAETEQPAGLDHVRALAAAVVSGSVWPEMLEQVDEATFEWLSVLDRKMAASVLMADDATLRAHVRGQSSIRGVVPAD